LPVKRKPLWRRLLKWLLIVVLLLALVTVAAGVYLSTRVPKDSLDPVAPGSLTVNAEPTVVATGPFDIELTDNALRVSRDGLIAWQSQPTVPFVAAGRGTVDWTENFGYFWADVQRDAVWADQTVDTVVRNGPAVQVKGTLRGDGGSADYTLSLLAVPKSASVRALQMELTVEGADSVMLTAGIAKGERIFGLGEQYRPLDLTGTLTPIRPQEQGIGRGEQPITYLADVTNNGAGGNLATTYAAWPSYITSANKAFRFADTEAGGAFTVADFTRNGQAGFETWSPTMSAEVFVEDTPADVIRARETGRERPALADWIQRGAVLGIQGGTQKVRRVVEDMQQAGASVSGVWLQDWIGTRVTDFGDQLWWTWQLDKQQYPQWHKLVRDLEADGIKVMTYVNPFLVDTAVAGAPDVDNLYEEAIDKGFVVQAPDGGPYVIETVGFPTVLVDFTNPDAWDWYADIIAERVLGAGAAGFMADFGEGLPYDSRLFDGDGASVHNRYPQLYASAVREGCERGGVPDCVAFMRSGYLGSAEQVPLMWAGDQMVTFSEQDGLASTIHGMLSGGLSGSPLWHSDVGGYTSINAVVKNYVRPPELNTRWAQMQAFGVVMRTHETNRPAVNEQVYDTPATRAAFAESSRIYAALYEYRRSVIDEAVATGVPAMRPTWMVFPDSDAAAADLQFFLGEHLLVAPVLAQGEETVEVSFPPGEWVHVLTGETYDGDVTVEVPAPLDTPAAFVLADDPVGEQIREALAER
jgi:alpha-glucosidase